MAEPIKPRVPSYKQEASYAAPPPDVLNGSAPAGERPVLIKSIEEARPASQQPRGSDALISAVGKIYQAVTAQIAYHEREAAKLRDSLKPFAGMAPRPVPPEGEPNEETIRQVLAWAEKNSLSGEQS